MLTTKDYNKASASFFVLIFAAGLLVGGILFYYSNFQQVNNLNEQIFDLESRISAVQGTQNATYQEITLVQNGTSLAEIYSNVRQSVVLIQGRTNAGGVQGSGFIYYAEGRNVVLTNYHVVEGTTSLSVTFYDGMGYPATILGADPYSDLAVVSVSDVPASKLKPLTIVGSSTLRVGEQVIAIGNPYGLVGSLTTGVVSALGRSITEDTTNRFAIPNIIQTSTPINPGNSGGPLLNAVGNVVGITTAIVSDSQGLGFAIPSNTILREISALIRTGTYRGHSYLGVNGLDMNYEYAQELGAEVTYGWRIERVIEDSPSDGKLRVGDIVIALDEQTIRNNDDLASYLAENTLPGDALDITVIRGREQVHVTVVLGPRPALNT